CQQHYNYPYNF
nr:immunoglobulin light chain junction region [Macaca mulatta]